MYVEWLEPLGRWGERTRLTKGVWGREFDTNWYRLKAYVGIGWSADRIHSGMRVDLDNWNQWIGWVRIAFGEKRHGRR